VLVDRHNATVPRRDRTPHTGRRLLAAAGIVGPCVFIADWATLGARAKQYSPISDAISELARLHAPTRPAMTAGFIIFGASLPVYAVALRDALPGAAWQFAVGNGLATFGVAAFPLGTAVSGTIHGVFAGLSYATLAAIPLAASRPLRRRGDVRSSRASVVSGVACAGFLVASVVGPTHVHGLLQRVGLTIGDVWVIVSAARIARRTPAAMPVDRP
jgi:hypothetical membrane protein